MLDCAMQTAERTQTITHLDCHFKISSTLPSTLATFPVFHCLTQSCSSSWGTAIALVESYFQGPQAPKTKHHAATRPPRLAVGAGQLRGEVRGYFIGFASTCTSELLMQVVRMPTQLAPARQAHFAATELAHGKVYRSNGDRIRWWIGHERWL